ncbi:MAG: hypothetical protein J6Y36_06980 [Treponema sp.]|nr:hypothetical protein [Treponema sp.]
MKKYLSVKEREEKEYSKRFAALVMVTMYSIAMTPFGLFANESAANEAFLNNLSHSAPVISEVDEGIKTEGLSEVSLAPAALETEKDTPEVKSVKKIKTAPEVKVESEQIKDEWGDLPLEVKSLITKKDGGVITLGNVSIEIPAGAVKKDTEISITRLEEVQETGEMLANATQFMGGYRFLPAGTKFKKKVTVSIPYSKEINNNEQKLNDLYTYFYDTKENRWVKLERKEIDRENCIVKSYTTHFTDMINGTLTMPDAASSVSFDINTIKGLEASKPDGHLLNFNPPSASNTGDASFSFGLSVPAGRLGMQPSVSVGYSSGSGNGIVGRGFNVNYCSVISTDTRNGLPEYNGHDTYLKDGVLLELDKSVSSENLQVYGLKRETGYEKIVRHNPGKEDDYWEVTSSDGVISRYGKYVIYSDEVNNSCSTAEITENNVTKNCVYEWYLSEVVDIHGNTILFTYVKDKGYVYPKLIRYTGKTAGKINSASVTKKGNYFVRFDYYYTDSDNAGAEKRRDVRIDARSRNIKECRWLLKQISTGYDPDSKVDLSYSTADLKKWYDTIQKEVSIRVYEFNYAPYDSNLIEVDSFLNELKVYNKGMNDSYSYYFDYNRIQKDKMFASQAKVAYSDGSNNNFILHTGNSMGAGANVRAQAGAGFGTPVADIRVTGGFNGSVDGSFGYTDNCMADINGDGIPDGLDFHREADKNNVTVQYGKNPSPDYITPEPSEINIQELDREDSVSTNFGGDVYAGAGLKNKYITGLGASINGVTQNSVTRVSRSLMDVDGDGLVDIIETGKNTYLKNKGNGKFVKRKIYTSSSNPIKDLDKKLDITEQNQYRNTYMPQTPFRVWKAPFTGIVEITNTVSKTENFDAKIIAETYVGNTMQNNLCIVLQPNDSNEDKFVSGTVKVLKDQNVYFYVNSGFEPKNTDIEWNTKINYKSIEPLQSVYKLPYFVLNKNITLTGTITAISTPSEKDVKNAAKNKSDYYSIILDAYNVSSYTVNSTEGYGSTGSTIYEYTVNFTLKDKWQDGFNLQQRKNIYNAIIGEKEGKVIPGCYFENEFEQLWKDFEDNFVKKIYPVEYYDKLLKIFASIFRYNADKDVYELCDLTQSQQELAWNVIFSKLTPDIQEKLKTDFLNKYMENTVFETEDYFKQFDTNAVVFGKTGLLEDIIGDRTVDNVGNYKKLTDDSTDEILYKLYLGNIDGKKLELVFDKFPMDAGSNAELYLDNAESEKISGFGKICDDEDVNISFTYDGRQKLTYGASGLNNEPALITEEQYNDCVAKLKEWILNGKIKNVDDNLVSLASEIKELDKKIENLAVQYEEETSKPEEERDDELISKLAMELEEAKEKLDQNNEGFNRSYNNSHYSSLNGIYKKDTDGNYCITGSWKDKKRLEDFPTEVPEVFDREAFDLYCLNKEIIEKLAVEFCLYNAEKLSVSIDYAGDEEYDICKDGEGTYYNLLVLSGQNDFVYQRNIFRENIWDSEIDFKPENKDPSKTLFNEKYDASYEEDGETISKTASYEVYRDEKLFGGNNDWYYGIWQGNEKFNPENIYTSKYAGNDYSNMTEEDVKKKREENENSLSSVDSKDSAKDKLGTQKVDSFYNPTINQRIVESESGEEKPITAITEEADTEINTDSNIKDIIMGNISTVSKLESPDKLTTYYYVPYIYKNYIHANRLGGSSYYDIEGIEVVQIFDGTGSGAGNSNDPDSNQVHNTDKKTLTIPTIRKTETTAEDFIWGVNAKVNLLGMDVNLSFDTKDGFGVSSMEKGNDAENESHNQILQYYQDVNGDRIPDFIQKEGGSRISVTPGFKVYDDNSENEEKYEIIYGEKYYPSGIDRISHTTNTTKTKGGNVTEKGAVTPEYSTTGEFKMARTNAASDGSGNKSISAGSSRQTAGLMDVNGDGLPDYVDGTSVSINQGNNFKKYSDFTNLYSNISKSENESMSITKPIKRGPGQGESLSNGVVLGACVVFNYSRNNVKAMYLDVNGDGLPDIITKEIGESEKEHFWDKEEKLVANRDWYVRFNTGNGFTDAVKFSMPSWNISDADKEKFKKDHDNELLFGFVNSIPYVGEDIAGLLTKYVVKFENPYAKDFDVYCDSLDFSSTASVGIAASVGGTGTGSIPIPFTTFSVNITGEGSAGVNANTSMNSISVTMQDITGDGLPDHVMRIPGQKISIDFNDVSLFKDDGYVLYKENITGQSGLLNKVHMPNGSSLEIGYEGKHGTPDMPSYKYVMAYTTVSDGNGVTVPEVNYTYDAGISLDDEDKAEYVHETTTKYEYHHAKYNREEKEFYGYETVKTVNPDNTYVVTKYCNDIDKYYKKGAILRQEVYSGSDYEHSYLMGITENTYYENAPSLLIKSTVTYQYEYDSSQTTNEDCFETKSEFEYDEYNNVKKIIQSYNDESIHDIEADISYYKNKSLGIYSKPNSIKVYDLKNTSEPIRERSAVYENGELKYLRFGYIDEYGSRKDSETEFAYDDYGNMTSIKSPTGVLDNFTYENKNYQFVENVIKISRDYKKYETSYQNDCSTQLVSSCKDLNELVMKYEYDDWQRLSKVYSPYDSSNPAVSYEYYTPLSAAVYKDGVNTLDKHDFWYAKTNNKVSFDSSDSKYIPTIIQADGFGRVLRTICKSSVYQGKDAEDKVGYVVSGAAIIDNMGRTVVAGDSYFVNESDWAFTNKEDLNLIVKSPTINKYDEKGRAVLTKCLFEEKIPDSDVSNLTWISTKKAFSLKNKELHVVSTDPKNNYVETIHDVKSAVKKISKYNSNGKLLTSARYEYDAMGQMLRAYDFNENKQGKTANIIEVKYDMLGRRTELSSVDGGSYYYTYDIAGNLVQETNSKLLKEGKSINYQYDGFDRLSKIIYSDESSVSYEYGEKLDGTYSKGRVVKVTDNSGTVTNEYGKLGQVVKETRTIKDNILIGTDEKTYSMKYESNYLGQMEEITYPDGETVSYTYNDYGKVVKIEGNHFGQKFTYVNKIAYNEYGQRAYIEYGNGVSTEYTYDRYNKLLDNIKTVKETDSKTYQNINYYFDSVGNVTGYVNDCRDNNAFKESNNYYTKQSYAYDALNQLIKVNGETVFNRYGTQVPDLLSRYEQVYEYDEVGNMSSKVSSEVQQYNKRKGDNLDYELDYVLMEGFAHRFERIGSRYYQYDEVGNIILEQDGKIDEETAEYVPIEEYSQDVYGVDEAWGYYDEEQSSSTIKKNEHRREYKWNERNQLIKSSDESGTVNFVYGADGRRACKYTNTSEYMYFNDYWTWHIDENSSSHGGMASKHIFLGSARLVTKINHDNSSTASYDYENEHQYYYHSDHIGTAQLITDHNGNEYERFENTPYGETWLDVTIQGTTSEEYVPFKFSGKEQDKETGLYYFGARYYDAKYSMWISTDPAISDFMSGSTSGLGGIFNSTNFNLYHYANNNPIKYVDPDGTRSGPTDLEAAYMAKDVYGYSNGEAPDLIGGWKREGLYDLQDDKDTGCIAIYSRINEETGETEYCLANRGSVTKSDWVDENATQLFGESEDMKQSIEFAKKFVEEHPDASITFTGHSKGGAEAAANAVATGKDAFVFNPATVNLNAYGLDAKNYKGSMKAYIVDGEILNSIFGPISRPIDQKIMLPAPAKSKALNFCGDLFNAADNRLIGNSLKIYAAVNSHSMESVISGMKRKGIK